MKRIVVSVINDLVTDHRVHKVCTTLHESGYEVLLVGRKLRTSKPVDRPYKTFRMSLVFNKKGWFYAEYNIRLFFFLLFSRTDIFLSNDTDTLPANYLVAFLRRKSLVFDAHEMFPEVPELVDRPRIKAIWKKVEDYLFPQLKHCYTVCDSIAEIYNERYGINMQVVRNIPFAQQMSSEKRELPANGKYVLLYQGAVNIGRGIEWIMDAMPLLDDCIFFIAGDGDVMDEMQEKARRMNITDRVKFLGKIPLEDLYGYTLSADIGMSLLENRGLNYYYSLPNRIFDFMKAGIPILATDFPEIRNIVAGYDIGVLIDHYEPEYLAQVIREMIETPKDIAGFERARQELNWENESRKLLDIIAQA